jgi:hypothetical protein
VGSGFVRSLAHPGGNITGFISFEPAMGGKWLETLSEIAPRIKRVALIYNPQTHTGQYFASIETAARSLAIEPVRAEFREAVDIERTVGDFARQPNGRLLALSDPNVTLHRASILGLATRLGLPAIYPFRYFVAEGGLAGRRVTTIGCRRWRPIWLAAMFPSLPRQAASLPRSRPKQQLRLFRSSSSWALTRSKLVSSRASTGRKATSRA